ncbi:unnamed protein product [Brachionus calyciflorus]|uniref:Uncharacterized protein n=1 Tax=Brachionus calyciflorus TaxID=104777 RepID=A0A813W2E7_9BILA|nr:unnamed protein product [Brachionus calyciflorus]
MSNKIAIFDFDATIINDNSDTYINELLLEKHHAHRERQGREHDQLSEVDLRRHILPYSIEELYAVYNWPTRMNAAFDHMSYELNCQKDEILDKIKQIKIKESMKNLLRTLVARGYSLHIVSDANKLFIEIILKENEISDLFEGRIKSNEAFVDKKGILKIRPYYLDNKSDKLPYNCIYCCEDCGQPSLCKRDVVKKILECLPNDRHVIYAGDGRNDFCPGLELEQNDYYFVRKGYNLDRYLENREYLAQIKANVKYWNDANDILSQLNLN